MDSHPEILTADALAAVETVVTEIIEGRDLRQALEELIGRFPIEMRDALIDRTRQVIEYRNQEYARRRAEAERPRGRLFEGFLYNRASAVLWMSIGTYEVINEVLNSDSAVADSVLQCGSRLLQAGATPDVRMLERLRAIYDAEVQRQRESEPSDSAANPSA